MTSASSSTGDDSINAADEAKSQKTGIDTSEIARDDSAKADGRGRGSLSVLGALGVVGVLLLIKGAVLGWGVYWASQQDLSTRDYERNFHHHRLIERYRNPQAFNFFELWGASDSQWYFAIAESGYPRLNETPQIETGQRPKLIDKVDTRLKFAFFPLWPLAIRAMALLEPDLWAAGFIAANIFSFAALVLLYTFLLRFGAATAFWSVTFYACSPFAMFFHVPYSESLFLLLAVLTFGFAERRCWALAGLTAGLGIVTRPTGIALVSIPLVVAASDWWGRGSRLAARPRVPWGLLLACVPLAGFLVHNYVKTGDPFYFAKITTWWGYESGSWIQNLVNNTYGKVLEFGSLPWHGFHRSKLDFIVLFLASIFLLLGLRVLPRHWVVYSLLILIIPLLTKDLMSYCRYMLMAWPVFVVPVLLVRRRRLAWTFSILSLLFLCGQLLSISHFVNWFWVA